MYRLLTKFSSFNVRTSSIPIGIFSTPGRIPTSLVSDPSHMEVDCLIDWSDDVSLCNEDRDPWTRDNPGGDAGERSHNRETLTSKCICVRPEA